MIDSHFHLDLYEQADIDNMMRVGNGYFVSFTPDIVYEAEIRELAKIVPIDRVMVETDGPWPFKGKFLGQKTHPGMIRSVIQELAALKALSFAETDAIVLANTEKFYGIRSVFSNGCCRAYSGNFCLILNLAVVMGAICRSNGTFHRFFGR